MSEFQTLNVSDLRESKHNPRRHFDAGALEELASSVKTHGVLTPILVRPSNGHFEIAAGHRRFRAAKIAGVEKIPAVVRKMSDDELLEVLTIENLQREDVHPLEEASGYQALIKAGYDVEKIASRVNRSTKYVYDRIKLLALCEEGRELFFQGKITAGHAILISRLSPKDQARTLGLQKGEPAFGALFTVEQTHGRGRDLKAVSVRELDAWIDRHVRFNPKKDADPMVYPTAAANLERAAETADQVVSITREFQLLPETRNAEKVLSCRSWKRADGELEDLDPFTGKRPKSKTCDRSVLGVVVVGQGRGEAFRVCTDKACPTHWSAELRAKKRREKERDSYQASSEAKRAAAQEARYQAEQNRRQERERAWKKAAPAILEALIEKVASAKGLGQVEILIRQATRTRPVSAQGVLRGNSAEAILKRLAIGILEAELTGWRAPEEFPKKARAFGVDVKKILAQTSATKEGTKA